MGVDSVSEAYEHGWKHAERTLHESDEYEDKQMLVDVIVHVTNQPMTQEVAKWNKGRDKHLSLKT